MTKIGIVTDSTADIPNHLAEAYQIRVVPNVIIVAGKALLDGIDITRSEFYELLHQMAPPPTTATASAGAYLRVYENLFRNGFSHIISIHASSLLSGIYNTACLAAQSYGSRVKVIDSQQISLGLGFQALAAAELIVKFPLETILERLIDVRRRVRVVAMLDTLEYIRRSGRVSWARARMGDLLRVKPFLEVEDGQVTSLGATRTRQKGIAHLINLLTGIGPLEHLAILHTNAEAQARHIIANLPFNVPTAPLIVNVTTVIGAHVGPNGLGFAAVAA